MKELEVLEEREKAIREKQFNLSQIKKKGE